MQYLASDLAPVILSWGLQCDQGCQAKDPGCLQLWEVEPRGGGAAEAGEGALGWMCWGHEVIQELSSELWPRKANSAVWGKRSSPGVSRRLSLGQAEGLRPQGSI
jgi:hypothetical protein